MKFQSNNSNGSTNGSHPASYRNDGSSTAPIFTNYRNPICDSNLNYVENMVENEFSDDEDPIAKSTDSKGTMGVIASALSSFFKGKKK